MSQRRIRRPKDQEKIYRELTDKDEFGVFNSYKDIFMISGLIGYLNDKRISFENSLEPISWTVFNLETDETVINAVALNTSEDPSILIEDEEKFDQKITIFEEFAAGGATILYEKLVENKRFAVNSLFELLMEAKQQRGSQDRDIAAIADIISFD
ncbi:DNA phosphorothioation-associated protein 4 [Allobacillus sp. GCM10007491]|uniref:DNA phosphorothioation-associated protein 4 n=1 Tax=Allobacillus saliphilus TaxID=2912308 RepID=A0A941CVU9_9BACI|nr:DNA phosphorothioation-associated protein 4 [Allobacillus saliphilus]MBR7553625.1 DNA phosphorothioation-associated protein 4 [Allobacillus saliphilus]